MDYPLFPEEPKACTVSELTRGIRLLLEEGFASVSVWGEIGNLSRPSSGHIYLSLKDSQAQIRGVMWRTKALRLSCELQEGLEVVVQGHLNVYPPRGEYQLVIEDVQPKGLGAQDLALRKLKEKLARLGYFAPERKKPLPRFPRCIALVTSPSGAAIRDILEILARRWPVAKVLVCPVRVQGEWAGDEITRAIGMVSRVRGVDVMILGRGGGSNEDLAPFNQEQVARAIFQSPIPVISAVGHEIDVTIADLVADRRALTPSEAAELAVPDRFQCLRDLQAVSGRMRDLLQRRLLGARQRFDDLCRRRVFTNPLERIRESERRLDDLEGRLGRGARQWLDRARHRTEALAARLENLSPLNVLARGYSLTRKECDQSLVRQAAQVRPGERVITRVEQGRLVCRVEEVN